MDPFHTHPPSPTKQGKQEKRRRKKQNKKSKMKAMSFSMVPAYKTSGEKVTRHATLELGDMEHFDKIEKERKVGWNFDRVWRVIRRQEREWVELLLRYDSGFDDDDSRRQLLLLSLSLSLSLSLYLSNPNWQLGTPAPTHPILREFYSKYQRVRPRPY
ncbi:hypothetical protein VNO77_25159 [Canavalia gladiata]|uniref:Uncharacterized protein n=1 Tax=Canavalia gladiata TaxID=3824 RepID=A0AAN9LA50_CANGL